VLFRFSGTQALFPVKSTFHKSKALTHPVFAAINETNRVKPNSSGLKPSQKDMKQAVKNFYDKTSPRNDEISIGNLNKVLKIRCKKQPF
jgi:hypothetical protein